jgi:hypothetical protein
MNNIPLELILKRTNLSHALDNFVTNGIRAIDLIGLSFEDFEVKVLPLEITEDEMDTLWFEV